MRSSLLISCLLLVAEFCHGSNLTVAEDDSISANQRLQNDQEAVSGRYVRFERLLSQMADMMGHEDPERAELLRRAISKGRENAIATELDAIADTLGKADFGTALERQAGVTKNLQSLLKLLQSEDRRSSVEKDAERLENLQRDLRNTIAEAKSARSSAQNSAAPSNAAPAQKKVLDKTSDILKDVQQHDDAKSGAEESDGKTSDDSSKSGSEASSDSQSGKQSVKNADSSAGEQGKPKSPKEASEDGDSEGTDPEDSKGKDPSADPKPGESEKTGGKSQKSPSESSDSSQKSEGDKSPKSDSESQGQPSQSGPPQKGPPKQGQQGGPSQSSPNQPPQDDEEEKTPGREQIEEAQKAMQEALEQLKKQEREQAIDSQDEAITQLKKAVKEIEEMLKQLREEEKEMILAALEARFQRLLALQTQIFEATVDLDATPRKDWLDNAIGVCRELGQQQADVTRECSQTTALLREDGTSVSIIVAVEDIESDMESVTTRLQQTKTGSLTQSMETDIIESLNELIKATQKEMQEMKSEERQQQQQQSQNQKKPPLVELMAEIRVLRSLQLRVNRRTTQVHELLLEGDQDDITDLTEQLGELANRQNRLRESAAELAEQMEQQR